MEAERIIEVSWSDEQEEQAKRPVNIRVYCTDKPGLLANISAAFTRAEVNISQAHCMTTEDRRAVNTFEVLVANSEQLQKAMRLVEKIKGVYKVERV